MNKEPNKIFQIKVVLLHTPTGWPLVWRRIQVPANLPLDRFHHALQFSMGWQDRHLHEFRIGKRKFGDPDFEGEFGQRPVEDEHTVRLHHVLSHSNASAMYEYDYGNTWEHEFVLEATVSKERGRKYPVCIDGYYQCPPEDCDGMEDYERLLRMSEDRTLRYLEDYRQLRRWLGRSFDPNDFSVEKVNRELAVYFGNNLKRA